MILLLTSRPLAYRDEQILDLHLREAGIRRQDCLVLDADSPVWRARLPQRPKVIVALGERAAKAVLPDWQGSAMERRGYVWETPLAPAGVVTTLSPGQVDKEWVPGSPLFARDLRRAKELHDIGSLRRPTREVEIVATRRDARNAVAALERDGRLGCDIENYGDGRLRCIGFAGRADRAYVFAPQVFDECRALLENRRVTLVFHNGFYDCYVLAREGFRVEAKLADTMLGWHSMFPELAGAREDGKTRRTSKALKFLASIYTLDAWWKDYEFQSEEECYVLNGKDCAITRDIDARMQSEIDALGVREVYEKASALVKPFTAAHLRGVRVDEGLRRGRIAAIEDRLGGFSARLNGIVVPLLEERADRLNGQRRLFEEIEGVCPCCRHASKKQGACWTCAGFDKTPSKSDLVARGGSPKATKAELEALCLGVCKVCGGRPRMESLTFNLNSPAQKNVILYDVLGMPKRFNDGALTTDEKALKSLLGTVQA